MTWGTRLRSLRKHVLLLSLVSSCGRSTPERDNLQSLLDEIAHDPTGKKGDALFGYDRISESDQQALLEMLGPLRAPTSNVHLSIESRRSSGRFSIVIVRVPWNKETGSGELHPVLLINEDGEHKVIGYVLPFNEVVPLISEADRKKLFELSKHWLLDYPH